MKGRNSCPCNLRAIEVATVLNFQNLNQACWKSPQQLLLANSCKEAELIRRLRSHIFAGSFYVVRRWSIVVIVIVRIVGDGEPKGRADQCGSRMRKKLGKHGEILW